MQERKTEGMFKAWFTRADDGTSTYWGNPPRSAAPRRAFLALLVALLVALVAAPPPPAYAQNINRGTLQVVQGVFVQDGQLFAFNNRGSQFVVIPLDLGLAADQSEAGHCPILNLELGPINLNVLGLQVDTSAICLDIHAERGGGNLLGNLLCAIGGLLDRGIPLGDILAGLNRRQLDILTSGLTNLINGVLNRTVLQSVTPLADADGCAILNLALGPIDLNLLGLVVGVDDCEGGPVTVDLTAVPGAGNLLGNLLCGIVHLLDPGITLEGIIRAILGALL